MVSGSPGLPDSMRLTEDGEASVKVDSERSRQRKSGGILKLNLSARLSGRLSGRNSGCNSGRNSGRESHGLSEHSAVGGTDRKRRSSKMKRFSLSRVPVMPSLQLYSREALPAAQPVAQQRRAKPKLAPAPGAERAKLGSGRESRGERLLRTAATHANLIQTAAEDATTTLQGHLMAATTSGLFGRTGSYAHSDAAALLLAKRARRERLSLRERLYLLLSEPGSSRVAFWLGVTLYVMLLGSAMARTLESLERFSIESAAAIFLPTRLVLNLAFTLEAALRVTSHHPLAEAYLEPSLWLDVLTVVPFWVRLAVVPRSLATPAEYLAFQIERNANPIIHTLDAFASIRLLKLARLQRRVARMKPDLGRLRRSETDQLCFRQA